MNPNEIHLPGIYVDRIVQATTEKEVEFHTLAAPEPISGQASSEGLSLEDEKRKIIAKVSLPLHSLEYFMPHM